MLVFQNTPRNTAELFSITDLRLRDVQFYSGGTNYPLTLIIVPGDELSIGFAYDASQLATATIERVALDLEQLLSQLVEAPDQRVGDLVQLGAKEQFDLLNQGAAVAYPDAPLIHDLVSQQAVKHPQALAVSDGEAQLSYAELELRSAQLASTLQQQGVGSETLVGVLLPRSAEMVVAFLAILKTGAAYLPIDPSYPAERILFMLRDAAVPVLITRCEHSLELGDLDISIVQVDAAYVVLNADIRFHPVSVFPENRAYVIYTSGSTGQPKGVEISHRSLLNLVYWHQSAFGVTTTDRVTQIASPAFDATVWELWPSLAAGSTICVVPDSVRLSAELLQAWLTMQQITIGFFPTPIAETLLSLEWASESALRIMLTGGDRLTVYPSASIPFKLVNNYGPTENTVVTCSGTILPNTDGTTLPVLGTGIHNVWQYILDENQVPVPIGIPGELYIGGESLARGYLAQPGLTAERFLPNPFSSLPGARMYRSGDLVRIRFDGSLEFLGRVDHQVKILGNRIELGEIEATLRKHPLVKSALVLVKESNAHKRIVAFILPTTPMLKVQTLQAFVSNTLPVYMFPTYYVLLEEWPLTKHGKIDLSALRTMPEGTAQIEDDLIIPLDVLEFQLIQIWTSVLQMAEIRITDNFFNLGGNSLLAMQAVSEAQRRFGLPLSLEVLFNKGTIRDIAAALRKQDTRTAPAAVVCLQPIGHKRSLFLIHPAGGLAASYLNLVRCLGKDRPVYALQAIGQPLFDDVEAMASYYIKQIQQVYSGDDYLLAGWSFGGIVAYEMARQLAANHQTVPLLALIDSQPQRGIDEIVIDDAQLLHGYLEEIERYSGDLSGDHA